MGRLGSDVRAVAAILAGAAAGVAGTVLTLRAMDGGEAETVACVELGAPRVVYVQRDGAASVRVAPAPRVDAAPTCAEGVAVSTVTVLGSGGTADARVRIIRFEADRARREAERARRQAEEIRRRAEEVRHRAAEVRAQAERMRVEAERLRSQAAGGAEDVERARREALERMEQLRSRYEAVLARYREAVAARDEAKAGGG